MITTRLTNREAESLVKFFKSPNGVNDIERNEVNKAVEKIADELHTQAERGERFVVENVTKQSRKGIPTRGTGR